MNKKMKKNSKQSRKPAFLIMGSTIALLTFAAPTMAQDSHDSKHDSRPVIDSLKSNVKEVTDVKDVKALPDVKIKTSTYINGQADVEIKKDKEQDNNIKDKVDNIKDKVGDIKDKVESNLKAQTEASNKSQAEANIGKSNISVSEESDITDVSNTTVNGKCLITFTVPEGKAPVDLDFSSYKNSGGGKAIHGKTKGTYASGKHTVEVDLPQDTDQCDLVISNNNKTSMNILWSREAGNGWSKSRKGQAIEAYLKSKAETTSSVSGQVQGEVKGAVLSGDSVITDVSSISANGKCTITFTVPQGKTPVDLEFSSYKVSGSGKMIHAQSKGTYTAGTHTVDVDLPKDTDQCDLLISNGSKDKSMKVLWSREAGGFWKALKSDESASVTATIQQKLIVTSTLIDVDTKTWSYKVKNPNNTAVSFNWMLEGTANSGLKTIGAGEEITLTSVQGGTQNLLISVPGEQSYDIKVAAAEFTDNQPGTSTTPNTSDSSNSPAVITPVSSTGSGSSGDSSSPGGTPGTDSGAPSNGSSPVQGTGSTSPSGPSTSNGPEGSASIPGTATSNLGMLPGEQIAAAPVSLDAAAPQTAVADASMVNSSDAPSALNQPSAVRMSQLPQTGESLPFGLYALGSLLILIGSLFIRKNKPNS